MQFLKKKIDYHGILHYILIYLVFIIPGSCLFDKVLPSFIKLIFASILLLQFLVNKKYRSIYVIILIISIVFFGLLVRALTYGGIGITSIISIITPILTINLAYKYDKRFFLNRFIRLSVFFFLVSLFSFAIQIIFPNFYYNELFYKFFTVAHGSAGYETFEYGHGFLFYSFLEVHSKRNCGIFTEPGVYQIILNAVLVILLFYTNKLILSVRIAKIFTLITIATLITAQSTSGYIAMIIIFLFYFIRYIYYKSIYMKMILWFVVFITLFCIFDIMVNSTESIIFKAFINKIFDENLKFDLNVSTGFYRMEGLKLCLDYMVKYPLGAGFNELSIDLDLGNAAGGALLKFGAAYGFIPLVIFILWFCYPFLKKKQILMLLLSLFLFINTGLAQTYFCYTGTIILPFVELYENFNQNNLYLANRKLKLV